LCAATAGQQQPGSHQLPSQYATSGAANNFGNTAKNPHTSGGSAKQQTDSTKHIVQVDKKGKIKKGEHHEYLYTK
jgi:carbohydrate-selective porin OprB